MASCCFGAGCGRGSACCSPLHGGHNGAAWLCQHSLELCLRCSPLNILYIIYGGSLGVVSLDAGYLPVQLAIIYHSQDGQRLHWVHASHRQRLTPNLHHVHWIIVSLQSDASSFTHQPFSFWLCPQCTDFMLWERLKTSFQNSSEGRQVLEMRFAQSNIMCCRPRKVSRYCRCVTRRPMKVSEISCVIWYRHRDLPALSSCLLLCHLETVIQCMAASSETWAHRNAVQLISIVGRVLPCLRQEPIVHAAHHKKALKNLSQTPWSATEATGMKCRG